MPGVPLWYTERPTDCHTTCFTLMIFTHTVWRTGFIKSVVQKDGTGVAMFDCRVKFNDDMHAANFVQARTSECN